MFTGFRASVARLFDDDSGQDLVEYALLTAVVGLAGAAAAPLVSTAIDTVYGTWVGQTNNIWESPDPAGS